MMATIADLTGVGISDHVAEDSHSFADVLTNPSSEFERVPMISTNNRNGQFAITEGKWKLIMPNEDKGHELYDLTVDAGEKNNLIKQHPEIAEISAIKTNRNRLQRSFYARS